MHFVAIGPSAVETVGGLGQCYQHSGMTVTNLFRILICSIVLLAPFGAQAFDLEESLKQVHEQHRMHETPGVRIAQGGCMTLDQAIESVRRRGNVERILSAETKREGNREVHQIRYLTKDGKVKTAQINGCSGG
jgi:hypothetical protein